MEFQILLGITCMYASMIVFVGAIYAYKYRDFMCWRVGVACVLAGVLWPVTCAAAPFIRAGAHRRSHVALKYPRKDRRRAPRCHL